MVAEDQVGQAKVTVFLHIPKTAGTSLRNEIKRLAPSRFCDIRPRSYEDLVEQLQAVDRPDSIVYAHLIYGDHQWVRHPVRYATVLRHPVERVKSWYRFVRQTETHPFHEEALRLGLAEILESGHPQACNGMLNALLGRFPDSGLSDSERLAQARRNLRSFEFLSTTETLASDLPRLSRFLGAEVGDLPKHNVTDRSQDLGVEDSEILESNLLDLELYRESMELAAAQRRRHAG